MPPAEDFPILHYFQGRGEQPPLQKQGEKPGITETESMSPKISPKEIEDGGLFCHPGRIRAMCPETTYDLNSKQYAMIYVAMVV